MLANETTYLKYTYLAKNLCPEYTRKLTNQYKKTNSSTSSTNMWERLLLHKERYVNGQ